ncbi:MAG: hypothetical protein ABIH42_08710 [Planctomycetota bacterium]
MSRHAMDMSQEREKEQLLPEGWRCFTIIKCEEQISKSGNEMFKIAMTDCETYQEITLYAIAVPKKRWFLKSLLSACRVKASENGIYEWSTEEIIGKVIKGRVEHQEEIWVNKDNQEVATKKHRIVEVLKVSEEELRNISSAPF